MSDYEYDDYNYDQNSIEQEEDDQDEIELENSYNQAEDEWKLKPDQAFKLFNQVIEKEQSKESNQRKFSFKSYYQISLNFIIYLNIQYLINQLKIFDKLKRFDHINFQFRQPFKNLNFRMIKFLNTQKDFQIYQISNIKQKETKHLKVQQMHY